MALLKVCSFFMENAPSRPDLVDVFELRVASLGVPLSKALAGTSFDKEGEGGNAFGVILVRFSVIRCCLDLADTSDEVLINNRPICFVAVDRSTVSALDTANIGSFVCKGGDFGRWSKGGVGGLLTWPWGPLLAEPVAPSWLLSVGGGPGRDGGWRGAWNGCGPGRFSIVGTSPSLNKVESATFSSVELSMFFQDLEPKALLIRLTILDWMTAALHE